MKDFFRTPALLGATLCLAVALSSAPAAARGDNRDVVLVAQARLTNLGYDVGRHDGILGIETEDAVRRFQVNRGLAVTGRLDPETFDSLSMETQGFTRFAEPADAGYYHTVVYNNAHISKASAAWEDRWHYVHDQAVPLRFGHLTIREDDTASIHHYAVTLNGHAVLFANNQPGLLRVSHAYELSNQDVVILTAYQGDGVCANKSYLLSVYSDGSYSTPREIGNCAGTYEAHVAGDALLVNFPGMTANDGWRTWDTWRYQQESLMRL